MKLISHSCMLVVFASVALACGARAGDDGPPDDDGESSDAIVGGRASAERAVVALDLGGEGYCSGALVAPNVVLTARHCVSRTTEEVSCPARGRQILGDRPPHSIVVLTGASLPGTPVARGASIVVPSGTALCEHDAAALILDRDVPGVTPLAVATSAPTVGEKIRFVGYGRRGDQAGYGERRARTVSIEAVSASELLVGEATCNGDSGGPALSSSHAIVGIVSRGGPSCEGDDVTNVATRADAFNNLVTRAVALANGGNSPGPRAPEKRRVTPPRASPP